MKNLINKWIDFPSKLMNVCYKIQVNIYSGKNLSGLLSENSQPVNFWEFQDAPIISHLSFFANLLIISSHLTSEVKCLHWLVLGTCLSMNNFIKFPQRNQTKIRQSLECHFTTIPKKRVPRQNARCYDLGFIISWFLSI